MKNSLKNYLKRSLEHMKYYNLMSPFPMFDTEYVKDVETKINKMEEDKIDYDNEPVVACRFCKNLHIVIDDDNNDHCVRCKSVNELQEFKNIHEYNQFKNGRE